MLNSETLQISKLRRFGSGWKITVVAVALTLAIFLAWARVRFGTTSAALEYLSGRRLIADSRTQFVGNLAPGSTEKAVFRLRNLAGHPVQIVGSRSSCTCTVAEGIPLTLAPSEERTISVSIHGSGQKAVIEETVHLFTDLAEQPVLSLNIKARMTENH